VQKLWEMQRRLIPEGMTDLRKRFLILHHLKVNGQAGRRSMVQALGYSERVLRRETDFLKIAGLIEVDPAGMRITAEGIDLVESLEPAMNEWFGMDRLAQQISKRFGLRHAVVVRGDTDSSDSVRREIGRAAGSYLREQIRPGDVVTVTGGSTLAAVAEQIPTTPQLTENWFVPSRGGLGEDVTLQANTVASTMARRTGAHHRLLHVPDHLSEETHLSLMQEPSVVEVVQAIRSARIVVHGIGDATRMAERRHVPDEQIEQLKQDGALAEALGYYFDRFGNVVRETPTVGLSKADWQRAEQVIAVAGGASKAEAIAAVLRFGNSHVLVTDEAAADRLVKL
jgi:central glycolytic genes regulator